jgi:pimeloyl-ACP methyl ester carboxylesterase
VLLASAPPNGIRGFLARRLKRHPWYTASGLAMTRSLRGVGATPELARETFFSQSTPEADVARYAAALDEEYALKIAIDMLWLNLPRPHLVTTPLLVLGAEDDVCFTAQEVRATAAAYDTEAEIFPKMSHDMMLDPGWRAVAERIHAWVEICVPAS